MHVSIFLHTPVYHALHMFVYSMHIPVYLFHMPVYPQHMSVYVLHMLVYSMHIAGLELLSRKQMGMRLLSHINYLYQNNSSVIHTQSHTQDVKKLLA